MLADVAARAKVGLSTVDRVLNDRGNVSPATARKVLEAARALGIGRTLPESYLPNLRIEFILQRPDKPLIARLADFLRTRTHSYGRTVSLNRTLIRDESPETLVQAIRSSSADAIVLNGPEHPDVITAIAEKSALGVPCFTIISDIPASARLAYSGTDHCRAGAVAAHLVASMARRDGPVVVICNRLVYSAHRRRLDGFRAGLARWTPGRKIAAVLEGHDDDLVSFNLLTEAFVTQRNAAALYNIGGANEAVAQALVKSFGADRPVFIGHELTPENRLLLDRGVLSMVIDQSPEEQADYAINALKHHFGYDGLSFIKTPYRSPVQFRLHGPENT